MSAPDQLTLYRALMETTGMASALQLWPDRRPMDPLNEVRLLTPDERDALRAKLSRIAEDPDVRVVYRIGAVFYGLAIDLIKRVDARL